jgi:hypothetical protein
MFNRGRWNHDESFMLGAIAWTGGIAADRLWIAQNGNVWPAILRVNLNIREKSSAAFNRKILQNSAGR